MCVHILFIYLSVGIELLQSLAIMNCAPVHIHVQVSILSPFFQIFGYIVRGGVVGSNNNLCLIFEELRNCFFRVAIPFYILTSKTQEFQFLHHILASSDFLFFLKPS